ncbi:unnamed protein product, partial [Allacma fusca]
MDVSDNTRMRKASPDIIDGYYESLTRPQ